MKTLLLAAIYLPVLAFGKDKPQQTYPLHGVVIAIHTGRTRTGAYTDPYGKTWGTGGKETHIYRIETDTLIYEITKRGTEPRFSVGDAVDFRINIKKESVWIREGDKEQEYWLTGTEQKPPVGK
jgi:hypothetical protein